VVSIVLVAGSGDAEVAALRTVAGRLFEEADVFAMSIDDGSVDPELAWGTASHEVHLVDVEGEPVRATGDELAEEDALEQPMPAVGDSAVAVVEAARRIGADLVVVARDDRSAAARLFGGSAVGDLVRWADLPVLVVRPEVP
jgi:nucleotide-binding universal stress UspA family protein